MVSYLYKNFKNKKILFIEDDDYTRNIMTKHLNFYNKNEIDSAEDCKKAYQEFDINSYDLIITDFQTPRMNCDKFIPLIRKENKDIPIFIVSADIEREHRELIEKYKINGYIEKPCTVKQIIDKIDMFLENIYSK